MPLSSTSVVSLLLIVAGVDAARLDGQEIKEALEANSTEEQAVGLDGYKCGALMQATEACYPKASDWKIKKWKACTGQCTSGMSCKCPNKGETCTSVQSNNPGLTDITPAGLYGAMYSVKADKTTGEWWYLVSEKDFGTDKIVETFKWVAPSTEGKSFVDLNTIMTPDIDEGDYCDPGVAAKYMMQLQNKER